MIVGSAFPEPHIMDIEEKIADLALREYSNIFPRLRIDHE